MVRSDGFEKDVALKLLRESNPPRSILQRFRDEARILGLVRDRAVVSVEPPIRLDGHWAVVMDFADGQTAGQLLAAHGPFPATVVLEIVGEVARALDTVWNQSGPAGEPLHLRHRDLKPHNLQVTPSGGVRILDFGIAKADFAGREVRTRGHVGGTPGYIAPERVYGLDGPQSDIYSLGVVLHELLAGEAPDTLVFHGETACDADPVRALSQRMRDVDPERRPTAREVERACRDLRRDREGQGLREWAEGRVTTPSGSDTSDPLVGQVLSEDAEDVAGAGDVQASSASDMPPRRRLSGATVFGLVSLLVAVASMTFALAVLWETRRPPLPAEEAVPAVKVASPPQPEPLRAAERVEEPPVVERDQPSRDEGARPVQPSPVDPRPASRAAETVPTAVVEARETEPDEEQGPSFEVTFASIPWGAVVEIDGNPVGRTPISIPLRVGEHEVMVEEGRMTRIVVGRRSPTRYLWRSDEEQWESGY